MILWTTVLVACALVIAFAGWRLTRAVDAIAEITGLGRAFLGMILVATVTSLPELATGVSAVAVAHAPDIAVGDIVGSCVFNLLLFVLADAVSGRTGFYASLQSSHTLTAAMSILLLTIVVTVLLTPELARLSLGHVGLSSLLLVGVYLGAARMLHTAEARAKTTTQHRDESSGTSLRAAIAVTLTAGLAVIIAGSLIAISADRIAELAGFSHSFVGVLFVGGATSLPEVVSVLAAIRLKAGDLAAGNLFGSNLFNVLVLAADDAAFTEGPLLSQASPELAGTALVAIMMTCVVVMALQFVRRSENRERIDYYAGAALLALFAFNIWLVSTSAFQAGGA